MVTRKPVLISTLLGSCVAVTMFEPVSGVGAICHAMLPKNPGDEDALRYVDTALELMHRKVVEYGSGSNQLVVKIFGGAKVLSAGKYSSRKPSVGEQNVRCAFEQLEAMRLKVTSRDTGGNRGRKLYFCTECGDVYLKRMRLSEHLE